VYIVNSNVVYVLSSCRMTLQQHHSELQVCLFSRLLLNAFTFISDFYAVLHSIDIVV